MVFNAIAELIADRNDCDVSEITPDSRFEDLGIDSLDTVEMLMDAFAKASGEAFANDRILLS